MVLFTRLTVFPTPSTVPFARLTVLRASPMVLFAPPMVLFARLTVSPAPPEVFGAFIWQLFRLGEQTEPPGELRFTPIEPNLPSPELKFTPSCQILSLT
jgi:hypothetical protein